MTDTKICKNCKHSKTTCFYKTIECHHPKNISIDLVDGSKALEYTCAILRKYDDSKGLCNTGGAWYEERK